MVEDLSEIKAIVRSILLSLGKRATEKQFCNTYYEIEGESFSVVLRRVGMSFYQLMQRLPDACRVNQYGNEVFVERVASKEASHMEYLTVAIKKKRGPSTSFRPNYRNSTGVRPQSAGRLYSPAVRSTSYGNAYKTSPLGNQTSNSFNARPYSAKPPMQNGLSKPSYQPLRQITLQKSTQAFYKPPLRTPAPMAPQMSRLNLPTVIRNANNVKDETPAEPSPKMPSSLEATSNESISSAWSDESMQKGKNQRFELKYQPISVTATSSSQRTVTMTCPGKENRPVMDAPQPTAAAINPKPEGPIVAKKPLMVPTQAQMSTMRQKFRAMESPKAKKSQSVAIPPRQTAGGSSSNPELLVGKYSIPLAEIKQLQLRFHVTTEVKITECSSPSQFIFQFNLDDLKTMMLEMNILYTAFQDDEGFVVKKVVPGMSVAAFEKNEWHRAEVLFISGADVFVLFVDNGSRDYIKAKNIRLLDKSFAFQSRKASKGILSGVKPANSDILWSHEARSEFFDKTKGKKIKARIHGVKEGVFELTLLDDEASPPKLSDYLISKGYAEVAPSLKLNNVILVSPSVPSCDLITRTITLQT